MTITPPSVAIGLNAVILAVTDEVPRVLVVGRPEHALAGGEENWVSPQPGAKSPPALPFGPLHPESDRTLERGLRAWVLEQAGLELGYVEQLYTFGDQNRDPGEMGGGPRVVSVAYLALVKEGSLSGRGDARWDDVYSFLPWEDWRRGRPELDREIGRALVRWADAADTGEARRERRERIDITFGMGGVARDDYRVLERYELLYEVGLVEESLRDRRGARRREGEAARAATDDGAVRFGRHMALDHRRILATALGRLRGKLRYRPVVFELLSPTFTLLQLQRVVEALGGVPLHKPNFRRLVEKGGLVEGTSQVEARTGGRPAELFRFRREVLRERPAPGVGLPGRRASD